MISERQKAKEVSPMIGPDYWLAAVSRIQCGKRKPKEPENLAELGRLRWELEDAKSARICGADFWRGGAYVKKEFQSIQV